MLKILEQQLVVLLMVLICVQYVEIVQRESIMVQVAVMDVKDSLEEV